MAQIMLNRWPYLMLEEVPVLIPDEGEGVHRSAVRFFMPTSLLWTIWNVPASPQSLLIYASSAGPCVFSCEVWDCEGSETPPDSLRQLSVASRDLALSAAFFCKRTRPVPADAHRTGRSDAHRFPCLIRCTQESACGDAVQPHGVLFGPVY